MKTSMAAIPTFSCPRQNVRLQNAHHFPNYWGLIQRPASSPNCEGSNPTRFRQICTCLPIIPHLQCYVLVWTTVFGTGIVKFIVGKLHQ